MEDDIIVTPREPAPAPVEAAPEAFSGSIDGDIPVGTFRAPEAPQPEPVAPEVTTPAEAPKPETPAPEPAPTPTEPSMSPVETPAPALDYASWLQEQTQGKVQDVDSLKAFLADPIAALKPEEQQLLNVFRSGIDVVEYQKMQALDFQKMEPLDMLRFDWESSNKHIPDALKEKAFNRFVSAKYPNLEHAIEGDDDYELEKIDLAYEAQQKAAQWEGKQKEMRLTAPTPQQPEGPTPEQLKDFADKHLGAVRESLTRTDLSFEVKANGETKQLAFKTPQTPEFEGALTEPDKFVVSRWAKPDGTHDYERERQDIAILQNFQQYISAAYEQGYSARESQVLKTLENPEPTASIAAPSHEPNADGWKQAFAGALNARPKMAEF